jgi:biotin transport system substrate-specific component
MLNTLSPTRSTGLPARLAGIAAFAALTALAARITLETGGPVPFTLQVLPTLVAGLVLGWRDGALSQIAYLALIAAGLPLDARALGAAAFAGPTAGFLVGFVPAAAVAGALAQIAGRSLWMRWLAGLYALFVLYIFGVAWLSVSAQLPPVVAFNAVAGFIGFDIVKALLAAGLAESGRALLSNEAT